MATAIPDVAPSVDDTVAYLRSTGYDENDARLAYVGDVLMAEARDQANKVRFPKDSDGNPVYDAALTEALLRRVARNLAVRPLALGIQTTVTDTGGGTAYIGSTDPEVRRLEAPYRKRVVG